MFWMCALCHFVCTPRCKSPGSNLTSLDRALRNSGPGARSVRSYGLRREFITSHSAEQNGLVERVIRTLKEQSVHRHRFESLQHASRLIGGFHFYNHRRPHEAIAPAHDMPLEEFKRLLNPLAFNAIKEAA